MSNYKKIKYIDAPSTLLTWAIDSQLENARNNPYYKCGIFSAGEYFENYAIDYLLKNIIDESEIKSFRKFKHIKKIVLKNGSSFTFLRYKKDMVKCSFHAAIVDFMINNDVYDGVIKRSIRERLNTNDNPLDRLQVARISSSYSYMSGVYLDARRNITDEQ